jgi:Fur family ferric uptake transcriptional regulator
MVGKSTKSNAAPVAEPASGLIRAAGAKVTRGRVRVLDVLRAARQPLSHAEVDTALEEDADAAIDRVTVYRILDSLVTSGLALKAVDTRGVFRYSSAGAQQQHRQHMHFRCLGCAGVFCLDVPPPKPPKLPRGFRLAAISFDVSGTCARCAAR